jgi:hypothetical protein
VDESVKPANVFISENDRCDIREVVGSTGKIYQVAGSYTLGCGFTDNVTATSAQLANPWQTYVSVSGSTVDVADYGNHRIRKFTLTYAGGVPKPGVISTIAGNGQAGYSGDNGPPLDAAISPVGLAYDSNGVYYIGDYGNDRIRKVSEGKITTAVGWGYNGNTITNYSDRRCRRCGSLELRWRLCRSNILKCLRQRSERTSSLLAEHIDQRNQRLCRLWHSWF